VGVENSLFREAEFSVWRLFLSERQSSAGGWPGFQRSVV
jgi:hypothetical protein